MDSSDEAEWVKIAKIVRLLLDDKSARLAFADAVKSAFKTVRGNLTGRPADNTVSRYLSALEFVEAFERTVPKALQPEVARLRTRPVGGVGTLSRWAGYDPVAALTAAREYARGQYGPEPLRLAEQAARRQAPNAGSGRSRAYGIARSAADWVAQLLGDDYEPMPYGSTLGLPVAHLFRRKDNLNIQVGVMVFGPFADKASARALRPDFVFRAAGLSLVLDRVIAVIADDNFDADSFPELLSKHGVYPSNIDFHEVSGLLNDLRFRSLE